MRKLIIFSTAILFCFSSMAMAEDHGQQCQINNEDFLPEVVGGEETAVDVQADSVQLVDEGTSVFTGDVEVMRSGQELTSDRATYNRQSGDVTASGNVQIRDSKMILNAEQAEWSLSNDEGRMLDADYRLKESHARGNASHVFRQGTEQTSLKDATYTTCDAGDDAWLLEASKVDLDHTKAVGVARNVVVRLAGMPVFYTPYISFPLNDERKSGFLTPMIGSSDETGFDIRTPYYWNIAPNQDATITPRYMSDRGLMLRGEYRYLSERHRGNIDAAILASDDLRTQGTDANPYYKEDRKHFSMQNTSRLSSRWYSNVDYNYVSDDAYLEDFGSNLSLTSTTHLNRELNVGYTGNNWDFTGRLQGYQTLTDISKPYQRLPQLLVKGSFPDKMMGLTYGIRAEYVAFDHDDQVAGQRFDIEPSISLPWSSAAAFVTPRIALSHTRYDLDDNDTPTRTLPIVSVDSGLFFEREMNFASKGFIHTLEPRAFYLYIPERDQTDIPIFDSSLRTFSMGQLFSHDRFTGSDRVGDTNQLSIALTSRIINQQTGKENLRVSLGQIQYFKDREVTLLPNTAAETQSDSDMVAEIVASIAKEWTMRGEMQWGTHGESNNMSALSVNYRGDQGGLFNVSHRYRRDDVADDGLEQVDISTRIPFNNRWSMVGRWYHSLKDDRTLEALAGIEYDSCCWATRLVVRDYVNSTSDQERNLAIFFQIELKGLGNFGQTTDSLLQRSILGYGS